MQKRRNYMTSTDLQHLKRAVILTEPAEQMAAASTVALVVLEARAAVDIGNIISRMATWVTWEIFLEIFSEICSMVRAVARAADSTARDSIADLVPVHR